MSGYDPDKCILTLENRLQWLRLRQYEEAVPPHRSVLDILIDEGTGQAHAYSFANDNNGLLQARILANALTEWANPVVWAGALQNFLTAASNEREP